MARLLPVPLLACLLLVSPGCREEPERPRGEAPGAAEGVPAGGGRREDPARAAGGSADEPSPWEVEYAELRNRYAGPVYGPQKAKIEKAARMVKDYEAFIDKYPETDEALDAMHMCGVQYQAKLILNEPDKAVAIYRRMRDVARRLGKAERELSALRMLAHTFMEMRDENRELEVQRELLGTAGTPDDRKGIQDRIFILENVRVGRPPLSLPPHVVDLDGNPMSIEALRGKVVMLDFWTSEIPECLSDLDFKKEAYARFKERGFEILGIPLDLERPGLKMFLEDYRIAWPQYYNKKRPGWNNDVLQLYGIGRVPTALLIDRKGILRYKIDGDPPNRDLPLLVEKLVNEASEEEK